MCNSKRSRGWFVALLAIFVFAFSRTATADFPTAANPTEASRPTAAQFDSGVRQAGFQQPTPAALPAAATEKPLMLPARPGDAAGDRSSSGPRTLGAFISVIASLAIVLGLFFVVAWFMRRSLPTSARRLPADVVETLGRAPLSGRQQMHVLRFGNKLLLVSVSPTGSDTLAEITDPAEIDRLVTLCGKSESSAGRTFKQIFDKLSADKRGAPASSNRTARNPITRTSALTGGAADV